ncbi:MAG: ferredoxin reductase [Chloroflexota bacterium]
MPEPLAWQISTVTAIRVETPEVSSFTLELPSWRPHRAGQHYDVRLTAEDGYRAQRSYSIASPPSRTGEVDLTIERIADGEVSPYFHDTIVVGDRVELRGPIGGYFVWEPALGGPLLLIAGGSGVVPLMAMLRERASADAPPPAALLYSSRTFDDVIYREELAALAAADAGLRVIETLTRSQPPGWTGYDRRIDRAMLSEAIAAAGPSPLVYICGPTLLVEAAANGLVELGVPPAQVRTERFGPTS